MHHPTVGVELQRDPQTTRADPRASATESASQIRCSLLYDDPAALSAVAAARQPDIFRDLNLDQVVASVTSQRDAYQLQPYFYLPLHTDGEVAYRHAVLADLTNPDVARCVSVFVDAMRLVRAKQDQARKLHYRQQKQRWLLDAAVVYCDAVQGLARDLGDLPIGSVGLTRLWRYLRDYVGSADFVAMREQAARIRADLDGLSYNVRIHGSTVSVDDRPAGSDYSAEVLATFERFRQGTVRSRLVDFREPVDMNHVEAQILDRVVLLHPDVFAALDRFAGDHASCIDPTIANAERETQFFRAYLDFADLLRSAGLDMTVPAVGSASKEVSATATFDVALANNLVRAQQPVVTNDVTLAGDERIIVVSGPNQGGKTTFSRTFGQLHYLGSLGLPVPGRGVRLFLPDRIFTHYERGENLLDHRSKLEDELIRIRDILRAATSNSVVIINEIFTSTTLDDAIFLGTTVLRALIDKDLLCVCVTFVDELSRLGLSTVSMVSTIVPEDPARRTFRVVRRPADGLAYAAAIAEKYGLSYPRLVERVES